MPQGKSSIMTFVTTVTVKSKEQHEKLFINANNKSKHRCTWVV